jgi:hypothetical protein
MSVKKQEETNRQGTLGSDHNCCNFAWKYETENSNIRGHKVIRHEFQELQILDFITKKKYEGHLSNSIDGYCHNTIIHQFQKWKGADYVLDQIHPAIK